MILVAGATGLLGTEVCRLLADSERDFAVLVRDGSDPDKVKYLETLGAKIIRGDLKDRSSLDEACREIAAVISTASSTLSRQQGDSIETVDARGQTDLIGAARDAGVSKYILISFPPMAEEFPLQDAKRSAESALRESGMNYTILQPTFFTEVWLSPNLGFDAAGGTALIYGDGNNKISFISYKDVAKFAVAALDNQYAKDSVIKLGGPEALSPNEVISIFERAVGKTFNVEYVPVQALKDQRASATDSLQQSFAGLMLGYADGDEIDMSETLSNIPVPLTSIEEYARSYA
jgi:uncharacterized protein YbjT (DUF2867 family)